MDFKQTLNMPKSGFPMRAGLPQREPGMLENWNKIEFEKYWNLIAFTIDPEITLTYSVICPDGELIITLKRYQVS